MEMERALPGHLLLPPDPGGGNTEVAFDSVEPVVCLVDDSVLVGDDVLPVVLRTVVVDGVVGRVGVVVVLALFVVGVAAEVDLLPLVSVDFVVSVLDAVVDVCDALTVVADDGEAVGDVEPPAVVEPDVVDIFTLPVVPLLEVTVSFCVAVVSIPDVVSAGVLLTVLPLPVVVELGADVDIAVDVLPPVWPSVVLLELPDVWLVLPPPVVIVDSVGGISLEEVELLPVRVVFCVSVLDTRVSAVVDPAAADCVCPVIRVGLLTVGVVEIVVGVLLPVPGVSCAFVLETPVSDVVVPGAIDVVCCVVCRGVLATVDAVETVVGLLLPVSPTVVLSVFCVDEVAVEVSATELVGAFDVKVDLK